MAVEPTISSSDIAKGTSLFPAGLLDWAGHRGGGVRRLFDENSGRPAGEVIETMLLARLRASGSRTLKQNARPSLIGRFR